MNCRKRVELLAPAGSMDAFRGAVNAGADAVYLAGQQFGARAYADNFEEDQLREVIAHAHLFGIRIYLTVNILTRQEELEPLSAFVIRMYEAGLDGVIVQDLGVAACLRRLCPGLELHASTQMSVMGREAVRFLKRQGFVRVVPARELSLQEIRLLKEEEIEIESFIHGAMCYSYSGRCLMSSFLGGRSGNRGRCAGTCRLPYEVLNEKGEPAGKDGRCYPISMRDMCVLEILPELIDAGIDSFKIEGRMKKPEYVAGTVAIYRKYIDRFYEWDEKGRPGKWQIDAADRSDLNSLYIRSDLCQGYYHTRNGRNMLTIHEPGYRGADAVLLERIRKEYLEQNRKLAVCGEVYIHCDEPVRMSVWQSGREDLTVQNTTGFIAAPARSRALTRDDIAGKLSKTGSSAFFFESLVIDTDEQSFLPVSALGELRRDVLDQLAAAIRDHMQGTDDRRDRTGAAGILNEQDALGASIVPEGTDFNGLQDTRKENILRDSRKDFEKNDSDGNVSESDAKVRPSYFVMVQSVEQAAAVLEWAARSDANDSRDVSGLCDQNGGRIGLILDGYVRDHCDQLLKKLPDSETGRVVILAALPYILRESDRGWMTDFVTKYGNKFYGFITRSLEELEILREREYDKTVIADSMLYAWNRESESVLQNSWRTADGRDILMVLPLELDRREMMDTYEDPGSKILTVYGRTPLMMSAGCVRKTTIGCKPKEGSYYGLRDRTGAAFPVLTDCLHCQNIVYNSVPTSLHKFADDPLMQKVGSIMVSFTTEKREEILPILECFRQLRSGIDRQQPPASDFTNGHYKKGAL